MFFSGKGLDRGHARKVVFQQGVHFSSGRPNFSVPWFKVALVPEGTPNDDRNGQNRKDGHLPTDGQKHRPHHNNGRCHLQQIVCSFVEKTLKLIDVVVKYGQNVSFLTFIKPRHALPLDVSERVKAHLMLNGLRKVAPQDAVKKFEQRFKTPYEKGQYRKKHQLMPRVDQPETRQERILSLNHNVNGQTDEQRRCQIPEFIEDRTEGRQSNGWPVRAHVSDKTSKGTFLTHAPPKSRDFEKPRIRR